MNKGLKALKEIVDYAINEFTDNEKKYQKDLKIIEKELKQAEENEKLLNIFKNALTIEYHDYPMVELDHNEDSVSYFVKQLYTIKQNEMDRDIKSNLREWLLKNAFPKELKALEIIKNKGVDIALLILSENVERYNTQIKLTHLTIPYFELTQEEYNLLKEVLLCH